MARFTPLPHLVERLLSNNIPSFCVHMILVLMCLCLLVCVCVCMCVYYLFSAGLPVYRAFVQLWVLPACCVDCIDVDHWHLLVQNL